MAKTKQTKGYFARWRKARREKRLAEKPKTIPMTSTERTRKRRQRLREMSLQNIDNPSSIQIKSENQPSTSCAEELLQEQAQAISSRYQRASQFQKDYLVNYLENNKDMANEKIISTKLRKTEWITLGNILNNLEGPQKTGDKWRKYWNDLKFSTKAKYSALRESAEYYAVNGNRRTKSLTLLEEKILQITTDKTDDGNNRPEVGFGDSKSVIYDKCGAESNEYIYKVIKSEIPEAETTEFQAITEAELTDDDFSSVTTSEDLPKIPIKQFDLRVKRVRSEMQETEDHVEKRLTIENKKLEAMEVANDLKREQLKLIKQQTEAIRADTEMKRYFCTKLEEAMEAFKAKS